MMAPDTCGPPELSGVFLAPTLLDGPDVTVPSLAANCGDSEAVVLSAVVVTAPD